jgi:hypothetical protein
MCKLLDLLRLNFIKEEGVKQKKTIKTKKKGKEEDEGR